MVHKAKQCNLLIRGLAVGVVCTALVACGSRIDTRGNLPDPERLVEVVPGEISRDEVFEILGSPTNITTFGNETWYYISERTETIAFLAPEVVERQVVILRFDKTGILSEIDTMGVEAGREVKHVERTTPTHGNKLTVLEQIVGNFQRFDDGNEVDEYGRRPKND